MCALQSDNTTAALLFLSWPDCDATEATHDGRTAMHLLSSCSDVELLAKHLIKRGAVSSSPLISLHPA